MLLKIIDSPLLLLQHTKEAFPDICSSPNPQRTNLNDKILKTNAEQSKKAN